MTDRWQFLFFLAVLVFVLYSFYERDLRSGNVLVENGFDAQAVFVLCPTFEAPKRVGETVTQQYTLDQSKFFMVRPGETKRMMKCPEGLGEQ